MTVTTINCSGSVAVITPDFATVRARAWNFPVIAIRLRARDFAFLTAVPVTGFHPLPVTPPAGVVFRATSNFAASFAFWATGSPVTARTRDGVTSSAIGAFSASVSTCA